MSTDGWIIMGVIVAALTLGVIFYFSIRQDKASQKQSMKATEPMPVVIMNASDLLPVTEKKGPDSALSIVDVQALSPTNGMESYTNPIIVESSPTPPEIQKELNQLPPYLEEKAKENYNGLKVCWRLELYSIRTVSKSIVRISFYPKNSLVSVWVEVDINAYPELKISKKDEQFWVKGKIMSADRSSIKLDETSIHRII
jgi:hypothetical protein